MIYTRNEIQILAVPVAIRYGIKSLSLFGSYARNEATESSDIDFLIDRGDALRGWEIGGFYADLQETFGKELDVVTTTGVDKDFLERIKKDEVLLYERAG